ncbi:MAG: helix-turn-helix transcriptional regulator [Oscillospiraceae bacterium]|nr:helix-turn-helix domain-containing protein [Oscillospiraceae bacterium]MDY3065977.1 helix-turn-helix transcriptional regulator [Oscillospiraceae bacterium]
MGERIKELRKFLGLTQQEFATRLGSVQNTITGYETGRRTPSNQVIALICREFGVSEEWLRTGEGEMLVAVTPDENFMGERIKELRKFLGLTQQEFAKRLGIKRNTIANYEVGRNDPIDAIVTLICREFGVSEEWLRTGEGEMIVPDEDLLTAFIEKVRAERKDSFKKRFVLNLAALDDFGWGMLERVMENMTKG